LDFALRDLGSVGNLWVGKLSLRFSNPVKLVGALDRVGLCKALLGLTRWNGKKRNIIFFPLSDWRNIIL